MKQAHAAGEDVTNARITCIHKAEELLDAEDAKEQATGKVTESARAYSYYSVSEYSSTVTYM